MFNTIDIVPSSIANDPQVQAMCYAIDQELKEIYNEIPSICFIPNIETVEQPLLDILMWQFHVDVWQNFGGPVDDATKRKLILNSIQWHSKKGTKWAVEQLLAVIFQKAYVTEWYQYGGNPYFFKVIVNEPITDPNQIRLLTDAVNAVKNERSWMEGFEVSEPAPLQLYIYIAVAVIINIKIPVSTNSHSK